MRYNTLIIGVLLSFLVSQSATGDMTTDTENSTVASEFQNRIRHNGSITFRSWNGKAIRMDSDSELTFFPNNSVHMFEWGYTLKNYTGTYQVEPTGRILIQFNEFDNDWPDMMLERDSDSLILRPAKTDQSFIMGNRGGAFLPSGKGSYWPFRMLIGEDEKQVLEMIKNSKPKNKPPP